MDENGLALANIIACLETFGDAAEQPVLFFGLDPERTTSPAEMIETLFGECGFDAFWQDETAPLSDEQRVACRMFSTLIELFIDGRNDDWPALSVLRDPSWQGLCAFAGALHKSLAASD